MTPGDIRFATHAFAKPPDWDDLKGECVTLPVRARGNNTCESAWYPSAEELALLNRGEPVILTVWGRQPALSLNVIEGEKVVASDQKKHVQCVGRVRVVIEIDLSQPWGGDCTLQQVYDQAGRDAINRIRRATASERGSRVVGEPVVDAIIVTR